jgi:nucleoside-diphosphate kinase
MSTSTFIMLKPDAKDRQLEQTIEDIFIKHGFKILRCADVKVDAPLIIAHYQEVIDRLNLDYFEQSILSAFLGKTVKIYEMTKDNSDIIAEVRELVGATNPKKADPNSIRGRFCDDDMAVSIAEKRMLRNLIHASDSIENAKKELALWFK